MPIENSLERIEKRLEGVLHYINASSSGASDSLYSSVVDCIQDIADIRDGINKIEKAVQEYGNYKRKPDRLYSDFLQKITAKEQKQL